jgi:hypothetical protein
MVSNNGYLISLQIVYAGFFNIELFNSVQIVCKANVFVSYIASFLSIWCVVFYNTERFVTVFYTFREFQGLRKRMLGLTITLLFAFAVCTYSFALFTSELESTDDNKFVCTTAARWLGLVKAFSLVDIFLSILIPFLFIFLFNSLFAYKLMKTVWANQTGVGNSSTNVITKTKDQSLFVVKKIIELEKSGIHLPDLRASRVSSVQPALDISLSGRASFLPASKSQKKKKGTHVHYKFNHEQVSSVANTHIVRMRKHSLQLPPVHVKKVRSSSLPELFGLKQHHRMSFHSTMCFLKYTVVDKQIGCSKMKKSSVVLKVWRTSMQMKRTRSYKKAAFLIMASSFCFFFLHLPMAWFKVFNLVYPERFEKVHRSHADTATLDMIEICERCACYLYYINFVSNVFFLSFKNPQRKLTNSNSKVNLTPVNQSKSNRHVV